MFSINLGPNEYHTAYDRLIVFSYKPFFTLRIIAAYFFIPQWSIDYKSVH